jgi:hypothetical protein
MRHSRSIELIPNDFTGMTPGLAQDLASLSFNTLRQWERIGGLCSKCAHQGWLDRREMGRKFGYLALIDLQPFLRCTRCENKGDNRFALGRMARD